MTPALVFAAAWVVTSILWAVALGANLDLRKTNRGLRDQLDSEQETAAYWYGRAKELHNRLLWSGNVTPSFVGERPTLRASEPRWTDAEGLEIGFHEAPRNVVPLQRKDESS